MIKKALALVIALLMCVAFSGCDILDNTKEMVSPPELTGEMAQIAGALYKSVGTDYDLKYPASGDRRSAIVMEDIKPALKLDYTLKTMEERSALVDKIIQ